MISLVPPHIRALSATRKTSHPVFDAEKGDRAVAAIRSACSDDDEVSTVAVGDEGLRSVQQPSIARAGAVVRIPPRSEPASGSDIPIAVISPPEANGLSHLSFCFIDVNSKRYGAITSVLMPKLDA